MNVGNLRIEVGRGAVRLSQHVKHHELLDCYLTLDEAYKLAQILLSLKRTPQEDEDLL